LSSVSSNAILRPVSQTGESEIYRDLLRFKPDELSPNAWAVQAGVSRTVWADMRRHGNPSRRTLEKLLAVANSSLAEFEALRLGRDLKSSGAVAGVGASRWEWRAAAPLPLRLIASRLAGEWGESRFELTAIRPEELIERVHRPPSLASDPDAFALTVVGDAMWPRFRAGTRIAVSPRAPVAMGDDVLVRLRPGTANDQIEDEFVLIKQLTRQAAVWIELRQFKPDVTMQVGREVVATIQKIVGELI